MPLPQNEFFEEFISKTKLVQIKPKENSVPFVIGEHKGSEAKILYLSYPKLSLSLDSIIRRFISELKSNGHESNYEIALATLGIIAETRKKSSSAIDHSNHCLSNMYPAKLRYIIALDGRKIARYQLKVGNFKIGEFDPTNLIYSAKRSKCDYPDSLSQLSGTFSIEHTPFDTKLIDWEQVPSLGLASKRWGEDIWINSVMDIYYHAVASVYHNKIPYLIKEELQILEAGALINFDINSVMNSLFVNNISLFQWEKTTGRGGWALMTSRHMEHMNFIPQDLFTNCFKWLDSVLGFKSFTDKKFDKAVASYCRFLQRAHDHRLKGNQDEAFLHFIIALDLIFGIEGSSTNAVCTRAAILVHRQFKKEFDQQIKILKRLYDSRSKYVHEGIKVEKCDLEQAEKVCSEILWTLLATSGLGKFDDIDVYLKQIDFVKSAISADKEISEDEFIKIGIPNDGRLREPPNRILD